MMPAVVVFEGEYAGTATRVPIGGVNNCPERPSKKRVINSVTLHTPNRFFFTGDTNTKMHSRCQQQILSKTDQCERKLFLWKHS